MQGVDWSEAYGYYTHGRSDIGMPIAFCLPCAIDSSFRNFTETAVADTMRKILVDPIHAENDMHLGDLYHGQ